MKVLVACEYSGRVRRAFRVRGHEAWSCDLLPSEDNSKFHFTGPLDVYLSKTSTPRFDLMIAHPPCTHFASSGARWLTDHMVKRKNGGDYWYDGSEKRRLQAESLLFVKWLLSDYINIPLRCIENPVGMLSTLLEPPTQYIQPHEFGEPEFKKTGLWLRGLPKLVPTNQLSVPEKGTAEWKAWNKVHQMTPSPERWKERSRTYLGIADAMAEQWGWNNS